MLKIDKETGNQGRIKTSPQDQPVELEEDEDLILCAVCLNPVTRNSERISINGAHQHTFANPHGIVFEIGCFKTAAGCGPVGPPSNEFSWFSGYFWRVSVCRACLNHIGWQFQSESNRFHGLILEAIIDTNRKK